MKQDLVGQFADFQPVNQLGEVDQIAFIQGETRINLVVGDRPENEVVVVFIIRVPSVGLYKTGPVLIRFFENANPKDR